MKIPSLFFSGAGKVARSNKNSYPVDKEFNFTPKNFEDFYFFIKKGYLLSADPKTSRHKMKPNFFMNDSDVLRMMKKTEDTTEQILNLEERVRDDAYNEYFSNIQKEISEGKREGYPINMKEESRAFAEGKVKEYKEKIALEKAAKESSVVSEDKEEIKDDVSIEDLDKKNDEIIGEAIEESTEEITASDKVADEVVEEIVKEEIVEEKPVEIKKKTNKKKPGGKKNKIKYVDAETKVDVSAGLN